MGNCHIDLISGCLSAKKVGIMLQRLVKVPIVHAYYSSHFIVYIYFHAQQCSMPQPGAAGHVRLGAFWGMSVVTPSQVTAVLLFLVLPITDKYCLQGRSGMRPEINHGGTV